MDWGERTIISKMSAGLLAWEKAPDFSGGLSVELPGIEPGSFVTLPGLLRAQFAQDLCSALRIGRTRPDDGPSHQ